MTVTTYPTPSKVGTNGDPTVNSSHSLLTRIRGAYILPDAESHLKGGPEGVEPENRKILGSSFDATYVPASPEAIQNPENIVPYENGFVTGLIRAFQQDLHLSIRPDDIWLAILLQYSRYVNENAEKLRDYFVDHEGRKKLTIDIRPEPLSSLDMGKFCQIMAILIQKNIKRPGFWDWIRPSFSTTTDNDCSIAAMAFMATMQKYFEYGFMGGCGFPSVTLLGNKADWLDLADRVSKIPVHCDKVAKWIELLIVVVRYMIRTFDEPESQEVKDFWLSVVHASGVEGSGRGLRTISGWISAFCPFDNHGKPTFTYTDQYMMNRDPDLPLADRKRLVLDGVEFPIIHPNSVSSGVVTVPVDLNDGRWEYKTTLVVGQVGVMVANKGNAVQPLSGWFMLQDSVKPA